MFSGRDCSEPPCAAFSLRLTTGGVAVDLLAGTATGEGDDTLVAANGKDGMKLYGGAGDDDLTGTPRDDLLSGGDGADLCWFSFAGTDNDRRISCERFLRDD